MMGDWYEIVAMVLFTVSLWIVGYHFCSFYWRKHSLAAYTLEGRVQPRHLQKICAHVAYWPHLAKGYWVLWESQDGDKVGYVGDGPDALPSGVIFLPRTDGIEDVIIAISIDPEKKVAREIDSQTVGVLFDRESDFFFSTRPDIGLRAYWYDVAQHYWTSYDPYIHAEEAISFLVWKNYNHHSDHCFLTVGNASAAPEPSNLSLLVLSRESMPGCDAANLVAAGRMEWGEILSWEEKGMGATPRTWRPAIEDVLLGWHKERRHGCK